MEGEEKEPEKSESTQSARLHVMEFQAEEGSSSRVPSAKSRDAAAKPHSIAKIIGLAGLQPVLGRRNEREIMNEYLLSRIEGKTPGDDSEADEKFRTLSPDTLREYLEEMLKSPKKLDELVTKGLSSQYDRRVVEAELRVLVEEERKAAEKEARKRPASSKEVRAIKESPAPVINLGAPEQVSTTGIDPVLTPTPSLYEVQQNIYIVGTQLGKLRNLPDDESDIGHSLHAPDQRPSISRRSSGRIRKGGEQRDEGTWSHASSEFQIDDEDLRGSTRAPRTPDWTNGGPRTADRTSRRSSAKSAEGTQEEVMSSHGDARGRGSMTRKGYGTSDKNRQSLEDLEQLTGQKVTSIKPSEGQKVTTGRHSLGQRVTGDLQSEGQKLTASKQTEGHKVTRARELEGQKVTTFKPPEGQNVNGSREFEGHKVTSATEFEGQKATSARELEGQKVPRVKEFEGQDITSVTSDDKESVIGGDQSGAKKKSARGKKGGRKASEPVQESVSVEMGAGKTRPMKTRQDTKLPETTGESQANGQEGKAEEQSTGLSVPLPVNPAGMEDSGGKKGAKARTLKTKSPRDLSRAQVKGGSSEEPASESSAEPLPVESELVLIEYLDEDEAPPEINDEEEAEPSSEDPIQSETVDDLPPAMGTRDALPLPPQDHHGPLPPQPMHLVRLTIRDNIFFGFYFTRAFVFSYFRTKPSHYDPDGSGSLLRSDVLEPAQRKLLKNLVQDPKRFRCPRDVRASEQMQALAKTAGRRSMATSAIVRQLHRLPNLLGNA